jgi:glyoxylase-like metal-dependent hydrolase (beta-lactamase superfamily II)
VRIHTLDLHFQETPGTIACYLVEGDSGLVLIETGPGSTLANLLDGISDAGFDPEEIRDIFVTHIHLDHAGAAGWWGQRGARIHVHPRGARHLADPSYLLKGATAVYGERTEKLWGETLPVPEEMIIPVQDTELITIGDIRLTAWDSPGHARHHHCWLLEEQAIAFTGDSTHVRLGTSNHISLASAPPQFDPIAFESSLARLAEAQFKTIYPTHFGAIEDVSNHLARCLQIIRGSTELVFAHLRNGLDAEAITEQFRLYTRERFELDGCATELWQDYELINPAAMCAQGVLLHCQAQLDAESTFHT